MNGNIGDHIEQIHALCQKHQVKSLALFGSAASQKMTPQSDVDLLVRFSDAVPLLDYADNYFALLEGLKQILHRDVDLVSEKSLKNKVLIDEINNTKQPIYESESA